MPRIEPSRVPRVAAGVASRRSCRGRPEAVDLVDRWNAGRLVADVGDDVREGEESHRDRHELKAGAELERPEGEAVCAAVAVDADGAKDQADEHHTDRLDERAVRENDRGHQSEHHQREVIGGTKRQGDFRQDRREAGDEAGRYGPGVDGSQRRDGERRPGASGLGHLVTVERGDDGRGLARQIDQDRRGRTAVLRAVVDARQHDQRRDRVQCVGER